MYDSCKSPNQLHGYKIKQRARKWCAGFNLLINNGLFFLTGKPGG